MLNLSGSADKQLLGPLTNAGTVVWSGSGNWNVNLCFGGVVYNLAGGLVDIQNDQFLASGCVTGGFSNAGTVRKSAGTGTTQICGQFANTGTVDVQSGTLALQAGGSLGGQFTTASGTFLNLADGSFSEQGVPVFSGSGQSQLTGGTLTLLDDVIPNLQLAGGRAGARPCVSGRQHYQSDADRPEADGHKHRDGCADFG